MFLIALTEAVADPLLERTTAFTYEPTFN